MDNVSNDIIPYFLQDRLIFKFDNLPSSAPVGEEPVPLPYNYLAFGTFNVRTATTAPVPFTPTALPTPFQPNGLTNTLNGALFRRYPATTLARTFLVSI